MSPKDSPQLPSIMANQQYCLKWNNHQGNLVKSFSRLLEHESFTDVTLACEGQSLRAHKVILSACSTYFETLFEDHPDKSPIIILKDMKFDHVSQLVNFMYKGEINITQEVLNGLLKTAETLKVKGLAEVSGEQHQAQTYTTPAYLNAVAAAQPFISQPFRLPTGQLPQLIPSGTTTNTLNAALTSPMASAIPSCLLRAETPVEDTRKRRHSSSDDSEMKCKKRDIKQEPGRYVNNNGCSPQHQSSKSQAKTPSGGHKVVKKNDHPSSPQPALTPIPSELTVNKQQELPDFLQGLQVFRLNDYLGFRTRQQFWEEPSVQRIMRGIKCKEIDMKSAAEILGVSYGTLYGRYREAFGYLKHSWVNKPTKSNASLSPSPKDRDVWNEPKSLELIQKVLNQELSLTAAAVQLGVDYNTFFAFITNNGKDDQRVDLVTGRKNNSDIDEDSQDNPYLDHVHATMHEGELDDQEVNEAQINGEDHDFNGKTDELESEGDQVSFEKEDAETLEELEQAEGSEDVQENDNQN